MLSTLNLYLNTRRELGEIPDNKHHNGYETIQYWLIDRLGRLMNFNISQNMEASDTKWVNYNYINMELTHFGSEASKCRYYMDRQEAKNANDCQHKHLINEVKLTDVYKLLISWVFIMAHEHLCIFFVFLLSFMYKTLRTQWISQII